LDIESSDILERYSIIVNPLLSFHESELSHGNFTFRFAGIPKKRSVNSKMQSSPLAESPD
jgi:hypothetical protein